MNSEIDMSSVVDEMKVDDTKTIQCLCGGHYTGSYRQYHFQSQKHQKYLKESGTRDDDLFPGKTRCYCGGLYKFNNHKAHFKTRKHIDYHRYKELQERNRLAKLEKESRKPILVNSNVDSSVMPS